MGFRCRCIVRYVTIGLLLSFTFVVFTLYWKATFAPVKDITSPVSQLKITSEISSKDWKSRLSQTVLELLPSRDVAEAEAEIKQRLEDVQRLCKEHHLGKYKWENNMNSFGIKEPPTPLYSYFFWNREKHFAWCPVYKAGSTSWLQNMMRLAGYSEHDIEKPPKQLSIWAREEYGDADNFPPDEFSGSLKLLVVRHPFERLLSAYRDKLSNSTVGLEHGTHHFYLKYGKSIVQKFRKDKSIKQKEPTWEEFVRYILKLDLIQYADDHWLPAYYSCTPCLVDYDVIAKTETYFRDQKYVIKKAGLENILKPRWSHRTEDKESKLNIQKQYFSQLNKFQVRQLYEKYKLDFIMFGYDYKDYLKFAKD